MPNFGINLISQGQLQRQKYIIKIISAQIEIWPNQVLSKLINNNFYILDISYFQFLLSFLAAVNPKTLKIWHLRLKHFGK